MEIQSSKAAEAAAAAQNSAPTMIIGAGTYSQVAAQMVASRTEEQLVVAGK